MRETKNMIFDDIMETIKKSDNREMLIDRLMEEDNGHRNLNFLKRYTRDELLNVRDWVNIYSL